MNQINFYVYILASQPNGTLYVGATDNLVERVWQHKNKVVPGFTKKYDVTRLVWFEHHTEPHIGLLREKRIKRWKRAWKIALIEKDNSQWHDLWDKISNM
ncbi:MAG: GIY-YIG nuclease [Robiginitomaculum sp.]|nr:MAG: GIY-YIG nuclease [Robiginitomaculum sp.]